MVSHSLAGRTPRLGRRTAELLENDMGAKLVLSAGSSLTSLSSEGSCPDEDATWTDREGGWGRDAEGDEEVRGFMLDAGRHWFDASFLGEWNHQLT